jgi:16S rRNA (adenine1518-N6/adenine1519-N6)-dimethyltransferase
MLKPKKSLGQNFLRDGNIVRKIVSSLNVQKNDFWIEIGPGEGALTLELAKTVGLLYCIEIDQRSIELLRQKLSTNIKLIHTDVLEYDFGEVSQKTGKKIRVVGNIPYYITSEILFRLFAFRDVIQDATLMMQKEVAERVVSHKGTKSYGILSVMSQFFTVPEILFKVSRRSFFPVPEVDSAMVQLKFKETLPECDVELFRKVVRATFGKRRKMLRNGLRALGYSDEQLSGLSFDLSRRPEDLSVEEFVELGRELKF